MEYKLYNLTDEEKKLFSNIYPQVGNEFDIEVSVDVRLRFKANPSMSETGASREILRQNAEAKLNYLCKRDIEPRLKELIVNLLSCQI